MMNKLSEIITELGVSLVARECGVSPPSVCKWRDHGRLPRTELTGETRYAQTISRMTDKINTAEIKQITRDEWQKQTAA